MATVISTADGQSFQVNVAYNDLRDVLFNSKTTQIAGATFVRDQQSGMLKFIEFKEGENQNGPMTLLPSQIVNLQPAAGSAVTEAGPPSTAQG